MSNTVRERQQVERGQSGITVIGNPKVSMVVACYQSPKKLLLPLGSFIAQTHENWECLVVHDGPGGSEIEELIDRLGDSRISFHSLPDKSNDWGNTSKEYGSHLSIGSYIGHSNDDNFYAPVYFEWMLRSLIDNEAQFAYCDMVHSHRKYQPMVCEPRPCHIDGGGWLCLSTIVKATPWPTKSDNHADGHYVESLLNLCGRSIHVPHYLFTHN